MTLTRVTADLETSANFVLLAPRVHSNINLSLPCEIFAAVSPSLVPIERQIDALGEAGFTLGHGDKPEHRKERYSLRRTVLPHGTELDPRSDSKHYFKLDIHKVSNVRRARGREGVSVNLYPPKMPSRPNVV
jgi:hypothetical protein